MDPVAKDQDYLEICTNPSCMAHCSEYRAWRDWLKEQVRLSPDLTLGDGTTTEDALQGRISNLESQLRSVRQDVKDECEAEFVEYVMDYEVGCEEGKIRFLENCGYEIPTTTIKVSFTIDVRKGTEAEALSECESVVDRNTDYETHNLEWEVA